MAYPSNIQQHFTQQELFDAFKTQLAKDFLQSNFTTDFVGKLEPDYENIQKKISEELQRSESLTDANIMSLLNRIDISEVQLKRYLNENKNEGYFHVMAELIIKRVLQKVVIKHYYKNTENPE